MLAPLKIRGARGVMKSNVLTSNREVVPGSSLSKASGTTGSNCGEADGNS
jgi:hypothetical protein